MARRTVEEEPHRYKAAKCRCCGQLSIRALRKDDHLCLWCFERPGRPFFVKRGGGLVEHSCFETRFVSRA